MITQYSLENGEYKIVHDVCSTNRAMYYCDGTGTIPCEDDDV